MMNRVDYEYYEWLISQIDIPNDKSYTELFEIMHNLKFLWIVPNDDNRLQDGLDLRSECLDGRVSNLDLGGATFLEVLIGLSRRVAFIAGGKESRWAWKLIKNIHVNKMANPLTLEKINEIDDRLEAIIWRTYRKDGHGGFFPLNNPQNDQTKVEIWYQMNAYVIEMQES